VPRDDKGCRQHCIMALPDEVLLVLAPVYFRAWWSALEER